MEIKRLVKRGAMKTRRPTNRGIEDEFHPGSNHSELREVTDTCVTVYALGKCHDERALLEVHAVFTDPRRLL